MKTLREVIRISSEYLADRGIERPRRMVEELLAHLLRMKRIDLYLQFDLPVEEKELSVMREWLKRAAKKEPVEYLIGEVEFLGCQLKIDPRVLIPRPETEILADLIAKQIKGTIVWDLCAGSGAIGISLKKKVPYLQLSLSDLSKEALDLAEENARRNQVEVETCLGDLLAPFAGRQADAVICNPPYISDKEYFELDPSVRDYEPKRALIGGERGTEFYERLAVEVPNYLKSGGQLFLEIGASQGKAVKEIFHSDLWTKKNFCRIGLEKIASFSLKSNNFLEYPATLN